MPTIISKLFEQAGLTFHGQVKWGQLINSKECGFYIVALTEDIEKLVCRGNSNIDDSAIKQWSELVKSGGKEILIDNKVSDLKSIKQRLEKFWLPDETIVYIGKAGPNKERTIRKRVKEYYKTQMGCDSKHAGGHWVKILKDISSLNIFYSEYSGLDIEEKEEQLILSFIDNVSKRTKENLFDNLNCFPFANKELYRKSLGTKIRKIHGLSNQTIDCNKLSKN